MIRNPLYMVKRISDKIFLLPTGQEIANRRNEIIINDSALLLLEAIEKHEDYDSALKAYAKKLGISSEDMEEFTKETDAYVKKLIGLGVLIDEGIEPESINPDRKSFCYEIGGLNICVESSCDIFGDSFKSFERDNCGGSIDIRVRIHENACTFLNNGNVCLRNSDFTVMDAKNRFIVICHGLLGISEIHIYKNEAKAYIFGKTHEIIHEEYERAMRMIFSYYALSENMVLIHSSSVLYEGKLVLFAARSKTGKSTQAKLWRQVLNTEIINGDLNLLSVRGEAVTALPTPWCGTSGIYTTKEYPVLAIVLLSRGEKNAVYEITSADAVTGIFKRLVYTCWNEELCDRAFELAKAAEKGVKTVRFEAENNESAVETLKKYLDLSR